MCKTSSSQQMQMQMMMMQMSCSSKAGKGKGKPQQQQQNSGLFASMQSNSNGKGKAGKGKGKQNNNQFFQAMMLAAMACRSKKDPKTSSKSQKGQGGQQQSPFMNGLNAGLQLGNMMQQGGQLAAKGAQPQPLNLQPINLAQKNQGNTCSCLNKQSDGQSPMLIGILPQNGQTQAKQDNTNPNCFLLGMNLNGNSAENSASAPNNNKMIGFMF